MSLPHRLRSRAWLIVPILALVILGWTNARRAEQIARVSNLAGGADVAIDATSPTGYAGGVRELLVPGQSKDSYQWIAQTQQMLAQGEWRVRHVDYDNAPFGRSVDSASVYRWWLGFVAWCDHVISGRPLALAVEHAAFHADPLFHALLLLATVLFIARHLGALPAVLMSVGMVAAFPFAGTFLSGEPNAYGLTLACGLWSVLPLVVAVGGWRKYERPRVSGAGGMPQGGTKASPDRLKRWFLVGGVVGGLGMWINPPAQLPILAGIAGGGVAAAWLARRTTVGTSDNGGEVYTQRTLLLPLYPWRIWAGAGAATSLVGYLVEYFPDHLEISAPQILAIHPLHAIAWWGGGELLARATRWIQQGQFKWNSRRVAVTGLAVAAVAALPTLALQEDGWTQLTHDPLANRLTSLRGGVAARNLATWISRDGFTAVLGATSLPLLVLVPTAWLFVRRATAPSQRAALAIALGPGLIALGLAGIQLRWWNALDGMLLALLAVVAAVAGGPSGIRVNPWTWAGGMTLVFLPGLLLLFPPSPDGTEGEVTERNVIELVERDLAHWLARQAGPGRAIVLAPPNLTASLYFHGGLRGLVTPYPENSDGLAAAVRIVGATSVDEAHVLSQRRELTHIVVPSWDASLDEMARLGSNQPENSLLALLHRWLPPRWLRPVPYQLPVISGFEGQSVQIFEVVDLQDNATALSRLAEYFLEMGYSGPANAVARALEQSFPSDLTALIARAHVALASGDADSFRARVETLQSYLARNDERELPWDRRVSLALVMAQANQFGMARELVQGCLADMDEPRLRSLTTLSLYRWQVLLKALGLEIADPRLRQLARELVPPNLRQDM